MRNWSHDSNPVTHSLLVKAHARREHANAPRMECPICRRLTARDAHLDEAVTVTLKRREWMVVVAAARDYGVRVPRDQGDGAVCLDVIQAALEPEQSA
jgi:hypothetical protein